MPYRTTRPNNYGQIARHIVCLSATMVALKLTALLIPFSYFIANSQVVFIPDPGLKNALVNNDFTNPNKDSEIDVTEAAAFTGTITATYAEISDLTGLESFTALTGINLSNNSLVTADFSMLKELRYVDCSINYDLKSLNVSNLSKLERLVSAYTKVNNLDVKSCVSLSELIIVSPSLTTLDVQNNANLTWLMCRTGALQSLSLEKNTMLRRLDCDFNFLTHLDLKSNSQLEQINCDFNLLTSLDVTGFKNLEKLVCDRNKLTHLGTSGCTKLQYLTCSSNQLKYLDLSDNKMIVTFFCDNNKLEELNLKNGVDENYYYFDATQNPDLTCIQVDNVVLCDSIWSGAKPATANFSDNCHYLSSLREIKNISVNIYPNPTNGEFSIQSSEVTGDNLSITISNSLGEIIFDKQKPFGHFKQVMIDLTGRPQGIYFVALRTFDKSLVKKIVIE